MNRLRTLIIAENLPYPTLKGGDLRTWQNVNALMRIGEVGVFGLCSNDPRGAEGVREGMAFWRTSTDPALAHPPKQDRILAARAWFLSPTGHPADLYYSCGAAGEIAALIYEFKPHIIVIERLWLYRYIERIKRFNCRVILDSHNVETALYRQIGDSICGDDLQARLMRETLPSRTETIERQAMHAVDQIWVCSERDRGLVKQLYGPRVSIHVVPNGVNLDSYKTGPVGNDPYPRDAEPTGRSLIFPAMFAYPPNSKAALFLVDEIFPLLAKLTADFQLLLIGSMPTAAILKAAQKDSRIVVTGAVRDMRRYFAAASAMVVPLFEGGGTRFKILEAFAAAVPVISTAKGAEGLHVKHGTHLLLAERPGEFVDAVKRLWADERLSSRLVANARALMKRRYSWDVASRRIDKAVGELSVSMNVQ